MAVSQNLTLTEVSQSIVNNNSTVRILWQSTQTGSSYNAYVKTAYYYVSINGGAEEAYSVQYVLPDRTTQTIVDVNIIVPHREDGTCDVKVRTWMSTGISAGVVELTKILPLTTIPRQSTLVVNQGVLGTQQTLTVNKQASSFTHTITYQCGNASGTICTKSSSTSINWTPPMDLASQNATGLYVQITFSMTTYSGNTAVGTKQKSERYYIPDSVAPYISYTSSDPTGYLATFGAYIQGKSKLKLQIEATGTYGAWITAYKVVFDGKTYTTNNLTTDVIVGSGSLKCTIVATDSRGRTVTATGNYSVLAYSAPTISALTAYRSDASGIPNSSGAYIAVKFSGSIVNLNSKNTATYTIDYKKTSAESYTSVKLSSYSGKLSVTDGQYVFPADTTSSYNIRVTAKDAFGETTKATTGSSVKKVWSLLKKAGEIVGASLGKVAELEGVFDIAFKTRFLGGILHTVLPTNTDLNMLLSPTTYMLLSANSYTNTPETGKGAFLEIVGIENGSLIQRYSVFDQANHIAYERIHYSTTGWGEWKCVRGDFVAEQGEINGWTYRKWNSGVAECWKTIEHKTAITTAWGSFYHGTATSRQNYPFSFVGKPTEIATVTSGSYQGILFPEKDGNGVNGASATACYNICRPSSITTSVSFYISFYVTGKWK